MARILVTEEIAEGGLNVLRKAGHQVDVLLGLSVDELHKEVATASALIIRSETKVTPEMLAHAPVLQVVGRAGIGLDNVDVPAATRRGVMVVNAPQSNIASAAEHTMALLLAQARNVPQAHAALKAGRWERSRWEGVELLDRTLGIVGVGRIGALVARRAFAFGMRLVAYDPFVSEERARQMNVELLSLERLMAESDFITIHLPKTKETTGLINAEMFKLAKPSLRVINVARGGIVHEADLADAIKAGVIQGAALDVFSTEPMTESPLFALDSVVVTPHLGASTREAQDKAGDTIADMVQLALNGDFVPFAVNIDAAAADDLMKPYLPLAERVGHLFATLCDGVPSSIEIVVEGELAAYDTRILKLAALKGVFTPHSADQVTFVNALQLAEENGIEVREVKSERKVAFSSQITLRCAQHSISGAISGGREPHRIVGVDGYGCDLPPSANMLVVHNEDHPGMIGIVGTTLGNAGVNIDNMDVGRSGDAGSALMVLSISGAPADAALDILRAAPGILSVKALRGN
jgi:D-3-phosphoglycerate dehydrogenase / 2-oxoglutarate reductase